MLDVDVAQYETGKTAIYPSETEFDAVNYTLIGLANEAGEALGKWKKIIRDKRGVIEYADRIALAKELGDVWWYLARAADDLGYNLSDIIMVNQNKLEDREKRGTLEGSGDDR